MEELNFEEAKLKVILDSPLGLVKAQKYLSTEPERTDADLAADALKVHEEVSEEESPVENPTENPVGGEVGE